MQKPDCHALGACVLFCEAISYMIIAGISSATRNPSLDSSALPCSHSAPGFMGALRVDDMWASVPKPAAVNPFDNVLDMDGLFSA